MIKSFVLGGSSSIGTAVVKALAAAGHDVVATYNATTPDDALDATWMRFDLRDKGHADSLADAARGATTGVLLPGLVIGQPLDRYDDDDIDRMIDVNFAGQVRAIRAIAPVLAADSQIVIMGSLAAQRGAADPLYGATKGAMHALAKSLAKALAPRTRVNVIAPGMVTDTKMYDGTPSAAIDSHLRATPTGHFISADDLARIVLDVTQPHWAQLNGACIDLNGGQYVR